MEPKPSEQYGGMPVLGVVFAAAIVLVMIGVFAAMSAIGPWPTVGALVVLSVALVFTVRRVIKRQEARPMEFEHEKLARELPEERQIAHLGGPTGAPFIEAETPTRETPSVEPEPPTKAVNKLPGYSVPSHLAGPRITGAETKEHEFPEPIEVQVIEHHLPADSMERTLHWIVLLDSAFMVAFSVLGLLTVQFIPGLTDRDRTIVAILAGSAVGVVVGVHYYNAIMAFVTRTRALSKAVAARRRRLVGWAIAIVLVVVVLLFLANKLGISIPLGWIVPTIQTVFMFLYHVGAWIVSSTITVMTTLVILALAEFGVRWLLWAYNPVVVTPQSITKFSGIVFKKAATVRFDKMTNLVPHDIKLRVPFSGGKVLRLPWVNFTFETAGQTEAVGSTEETQAGMPINRLRGVRREQADLISATYERYKSS